MRVEPADVTAIITVALMFVIVAVCNRFKS